MMDKEFAAAVAKQAREELRAELFRTAVEKEKTRLRTKRSLWDRLVPFTIVIIRKEKA